MMFGNTHTFKSTIDANAGLAPGFDFLRLFLASSVLLWHAFMFAGGPPAQTWFLKGPFGPIVLTIVPAFFALSGFLVTGSLLRLKNTTSFIAFRVLRIVPALLTEIFLSAMLLGPLVTELTLKAYFSDRLVWSYFTNVIGRVKYYLPGVFQHQYYTQVNGALWTVPGEMLCYVTLLALMILGVAKKRLLMACLFVGASLIAAASVTFPDPSDASQSLTALILCFYAGAVLFHYRAHIPVSGIIAAIAGLIIYLTTTSSSSMYILVAPISAAYLICYFGMKRLFHIPILMDGDHSYGIYLYHCPILQTIVWASGNTMKWPMLLAIGYPTAIAFSMFSWRVIEKPSLSLRKLFVRKSTAPQMTGRIGISSDSCP